MALVMFEGFNRGSDWDPNIWTLNREFNELGGTGAVTDYVVFGDSGDTESYGALYFNNPDVFDADPTVPAASARAMFPSPQAPPESSVPFTTIAESVCVGFRMPNYGLRTGDKDVDIKYWSIWSTTQAICTIELKGSEYQADPYIGNDLSKLTLLFKQSGTTVAQFDVPSTALPILESNNRKHGGTAYLNDGQYYFEFGFHLFNNTVTAFFNGTQLLTPAGATSAALTLPVIAGWEFHSVARSETLRYDDFYVVNSNLTDPITGGGPTSFLGYKTKVISPLAQTFLPLDPFSPGAYPSGWAGHATPSKLNTNDGDATILAASVPGSVADYSFPITYTNDFIGGVRLKVVARRDGPFGTGNVTLRYRYGQYVSGLEEGAVDIGDPFVLTAYYQTYRTPFYGHNIFMNLPTGLNWDVFDFNDESGKGFGIKYSL